MNLGVAVAAKQAADAAGYVYTSVWSDVVCELVAQILDEAIRLGLHDGVRDVAAVAARLQAAKPKRELTAA